MLTVSRLSFPFTTFTPSFPLASTQVLSVQALMEWFYVHNFVFTIIHVLIKFCSGGKGNVLTFLTDESFNLALMAILKKDKKKIQLTVEFNTDMMSGY